MTNYTNKKRKYRLTKKHNKFTKKNHKIITKNNHKIITKKKHYKKQYGGDVYNHLFCKKNNELKPRPALHSKDYDLNNKEYSVGMEYFRSNEEPFEVNKTNLNKLLTFKKSSLKWFKFMIFIINGEYYIYDIDGYSKTNKHPLCLIFGIMEKTPFYELKKMKNTDPSTPITETAPEIIEFNSQVFANLGCMKALSAGSGTINNDGTICINNKSGHFKAILDDIKPLAENIFLEKTGLFTKAQIAPSKEEVWSFLDSRSIDRKHLNRYTGLCIP